MECDPIEILFNIFLLYFGRRERISDTDIPVPFKSGQVLMEGSHPNIIIYVIATTFWVRDVLHVLRDGT